MTDDPNVTSGESSTGSHTMGARQPGRSLRCTFPTTVGVTTSTRLATRPTTGRRRAVAPDVTLALRWPWRTCPIVPAPRQRSTRRRSSETHCCWHSSDRQCWR